MKRVVLLKSHAATPGGLEKHLLRIAEAFVKKSAQVSLLTTDHISPSQLPTFTTKVSSWPPSSKLEQFDRFCQNWVKKNGADVVFGMDRTRVQTHIRAGNGVHAAFLESRLFTEGKLKYLLCKINPLHRKILELEKTAFEHKDLKTIFTNSHMVKDQITQYYDVDPAKIEVIHNGVEWEEMGTDFANWEEKKAHFLKLHSLNPHHFQLLFVGNGFLRKGLDRLLPVLKGFKEIHLSVVGKDKQLDQYKAKVLHLGLEKQVRFFPFTSNIRPFYQMADALAIPSFYDPFANVTVEALAMGLYVFSSRTNGGHEILPNTQVIEDLLCEESMRRALVRALENRKTSSSSLAVRESVKRLDFSHQLEKLTNFTLTGSYG